MHPDEEHERLIGACVMLQVLQFVLEAVRAESFNPATLFLFGCYTIGKERLFLEVARILQRKARRTSFVSMSPGAACVLNHKLHK